MEALPGLKEIKITRNLQDTTTKLLKYLHCDSVAILDIKKKKKNVRHILFFSAFSANICMLTCSGKMVYMVNISMLAFH